MSVERLFWQTPTGAMLWEAWARHKVNFLWQAVALAASVFFVHWKTHGVSKDTGELLDFASFIGFTTSYLHLLVCLGYFEIDARTMQFTYPVRLLLKPVSSARLVLTPMLFGGAVTVTIFAIWVQLVWRHMLSFSASDVFWTSAVLLSFFWWMQTLAWTLPFPKTRLLAMIAVAVIHFLTWRQANSHSNTVFAWHWSILAALILSAVSVAQIGLRQIRQGTWGSPSWISTVWTRAHPAQARDKRTRFGSAFGAQFWLEWHRQGWLLPGISAGMAIVLIAILEMVTFTVRKISGGAWQAGDPENVALLSMFILPLVALPLLLSILLTPELAKFDRSQTNDLPVFIAVRPMTNGGFVLVKLAMAFTTSVMTWLIIAAACACVAILEKKTLISNAGFITPYGTVAFMTGCVPVFLLMIMWTWKNLVAGIGAGLTGRAWIVVASGYWRFGLLGGLFPLIGTAMNNVSFRETLLRWLTTILIAALAAKIAVTITAFVLGLRRNAVTPRAVGWTVCGWLTCGLFVAVYGSHLCNTIHQPDLRIWIALGGFLVFPLADLAIAPLAMAWNRHR